MNTPNYKQLFLRYVAEIVVIFLGITISFVFDQWREGKLARKEELEFVRSLQTDLQVKRNEIVSDNPSALVWIAKLDSIQQERKTGNFRRDHLIWFYKTMERGGIFFFNSSTPTYTSSEQSGFWQQLPDSIRRKIYHIYMEDFEWNKRAYEQIAAAMNDFRNSVMTHSGILGLNLNEQSPAEDFTTFSIHLRKPEYGSIIQNIIQGERFLHRKGEASIADINLLIRDLEEMAKVLQE